MKALVVGWFSFEYCNATAGDLMAKDIVCDWLQDIGFDYDVAFVPPFVGDVNWRSANPEVYSHVIFICGPFPYCKISTEFLFHFKSCRLIGVDLSMIEPVDVWQPFDVLLERDSSAFSRPDLTFLCQQKHVPIVGIILVHPQQEYKDKGRHKAANEAILHLIASSQMVAVQIDTGLDPNSTNLRNAVEVESLIARMDFVITTRLHGTVLAIKNGVPAIVIDPIAGGAKVLTQARTIGWDTVFTADQLTEQDLHAAFEYCQTEAARQKARNCREKSVKILEDVRIHFINAMSELESSSRRVEMQHLLNEELSSDSSSSSFEGQTQLWTHPIRNVGKRALHKLGRKLLAI